MNYALGFSFTLKDMLITFPYRKLKTSSKQCESITGDYHRQSLFRRVFLESVKLIISDIIEIKYFCKENKIPCFEYDNYSEGSNNSIQLYFYIKMIQSLQL